MGSEELQAQTMENGKNPGLESEQIIQILFDTCSIVQDGSKIINPVAFIDAVEATSR